MPKLNKILWIFNLENNFNIFTVAESELSNGFADGTYNCNDFLCLSKKFNLNFEMRIGCEIWKVAMIIFCIGEEK